MYVFQADTYCDSCGADIARRLDAEGAGPVDADDERTYDSDDYPKGPYPLEPTDGPDHCAAGGDCLEAIDLAEWGLDPEDPTYGAETRTIGAALSDGLTEHGAAYLLDLLDEPDPTPYQAALHRLWRALYADELGAD